MGSLHKFNAHRDVAAASLASLAATLAAIRAHADDGQGDTQASSLEGSDQDHSSFGAEGEQAPMRRQMS